MEQQTSEPSQAFWERVAQTTVGQYMTEVEERFLRAACVLSGPPADALEVGCDGGRWSKWLADSGWRMTCTEVSRKALELCQSRIPSAKCMLVDAAETRIPCNSGSMRLVLCYEVWPITHQPWFVDEVLRVLEPGGIFVATCCNWLSARGVFGILRKNENYGGTYLKWKLRLVQRGFQIEQAEGFGSIPFKRTSNSKWVPAFAGLERVMGLRHLPALNAWSVVLARKKKSR